MQVILDSSFARTGLVPIWGGKKGEFRDWTRGMVLRRPLRYLLKLGEFAHLLLLTSTLQNLSKKLWRKDNGTTSGLKFLIHFYKKCNLCVK